MLYILAVIITPTVHLPTRTVVGTAKIIKARLHKCEIWVGFLLLKLKKRHLLLLGGIQRFGGLLSLLLSDTDQTLVGGGSAERVVGVEFLLFFSWNASDLRSLALDHWEDGAGQLLSLADLLSAGLVSPWLLRVQWEEDESKNG